mmetsp:Transcript_32572/g.49092  ORF Transcript_32572/g.49092 Transcript_32572/m.49092 type:complete len:436 (-) Transcript_32572:524-1831(-)
MKLVLCLYFHLLTTVTLGFFIPRHHAASKTKIRETANDYEVQLNPLLSSIKPSKTVEIFSLVKELQAQGQSVTSLCVGEPDFAPPKAVLEAAQKALIDGDTRYTAVTGTASLREAIAADLKNRKGVDYNPNTEIVVANGAKQAVYQGILASVGPGDQVLIPAPYWPSYPEMVRLTGAEPIILPTEAQDGFLLTAQALERALQKHDSVKLLIFCNPSNPTGGVHDEGRIQELVEVLNKYPKVLVMSDEIYERLTYTDAGSCPAFASYLPDRTMTINGFSKAYAMTGFRLGYLAAPAKLAKAVTTLQSQFTSCAGSISQAAGVAALTQVSEEELQEKFTEMKGKRDYVLNRLSQMPHVEVAVPPQGAFYVLPDISHYVTSERDDSNFCVELLQTYKLALVPGSAFGAPGTVRISYATSMEELEVAMNKLDQYLKDLL